MSGESMAIKGMSKANSNLTHCSPMSHFYTPLKRQKTVGVLSFLGSIEM